MAVLVDVFLSSLRQKWITECLNISQPLSTENLDMVFTTHGRMAPTVRKPWGNQGEHILDMKQHNNPAHSGVWEYSKGARDLAPASLLLLTGLQPHTHTLFLVLKLQGAYFFFNCSPSLLRAPEFSTHSGHSSDVSEVSGLLSHTFSLPRPNFIVFPKSLKNYVSPEIGCILGGSVNIIFGCNMGSGWEIWDLAPTLSYAVKWVWLRKGFHLSISGLDSKTENNLCLQSSLSTLSWLY